MLDPGTFAAHFARALELFRDPQAKEEQKAQFRALFPLLKEDAVTIRPGAELVFVNDLPLAGPGFTALLRRLELHAIGEIAIPADPRAGDLFALLTALAEQPGDDDVPTRLRAMGAERITARLLPPPEPSAPPPARRRTEHDVGGILRGDPMGEAPISPPSLRPPPLPPPPPLPAAPPVEEPSAPVFTPAAARTQPSDDVLGELGRNPTAANVGDLLAVLGRQVENAVKAGRIEQAMTIVAGIVRCEQRVPESGSVRRHYGIALKRMYTKSLLEGLAGLVQVAGYEAEATTAIQRSGADGVEVLLELLVSSPTVSERRGVFNALGKMKEGTDQLIHLLGHHQWYVVRNVAELAGELALDEAVPALAKQVEHQDERVRKAVALALAKIASPRAAEPLRRALRDKSPEVRIQAAIGVGGRKSSALAMPLVVAMEQEENEEVERELILALGRIGSADAVQALIKFAQPSGRLFGRRPTALRVAAVEALRLAGTPAAVGTLQGLGGDSDRQVRAAAQAALADLKK